MMIQFTPTRRRCVNPVRRQVSCTGSPFSFLSASQRLFGSAREALYHGLSILGKRPRRAHLPAYCCKSILHPLDRLGIEPSFYDVGEGLEPVFGKMDFREGDIFFLIHYFGIPQDTIYYERLCKERGMLLVEDCAHTLPDPEAERPMGSTGVFSIFSLRKMLPVPDGGVLVINDASMKEDIVRVPNNVCGRLSFKRWGVMTLDRFAFRLGRLNTLILKDMLRHRFSPGDTLFNERLSLNAIPEVNIITCQLLMEFNLKNVLDARLRNYRALAERLAGISGIRIPFPSLPAGAYPQAFPVISDDSERLCGYLRSKGIGAGMWPDLELPDSFDLSSFPGTFQWVNSMLLLPSHQDIGPKEIEYIVKKVKKGIA
ncbi:MAG: DegT/DnrJ/EryC1/StrS family aminotransferase [Nitrospirae bacterium]|nr:DegT/DnrJ/EryC1/StrS family aminotransferase [Nitrospirota bacterium]